MKRKFRGKRINRNGEWSYGTLRYNSDGECWVFPTDDYPAVDRDRVDPDTVGQFTGLKDTNDKDIYEGDIVSSGTTIGVVVYNCSEACYVVVERERSIELKFYASIGIEVIGNIHDNPEMV